MLAHIHEGLLSGSGADADGSGEKDFLLGGEFRNGELQSGFFGDWSVTEMNL